MIRARELACAALLAATAIGWTVDRALAAPVPSKPAAAPVPLSAPPRTCVLAAVDCTSTAGDAREEVTCTALAIAAGNTVVIHDARASARRAIVVVSRDACK